MSNLVSVVITTHGEGRGLPVILGSLEDQRAYIVGKHSTAGHGVEWVAGGYLDLKEFPTEIIITCDGMLLGKDIDKKIMSLNIIENEKGSAPNCGHHTRAAGIEAASGDWIVLTNADNYFVSGWRCSFENALAGSDFDEEEIGLVWWSCVHNAWRWNTHGSCKLKRGFIDLSCVAVRAHIAKEVGFPFRDYEGDWSWIESCLKKVDEQEMVVEQIKQVLVVHN